RSRVLRRRNTKAAQYGLRPIAPYCHWRAAAGAWRAARRQTRLPSRRGLGSPAGDETPRFPPTSHFRARTRTPSRNSLTPSRQETQDWGDSVKRSLTEWPAKGIFRARVRPCALAEGCPGMVEQKANIAAAVDNPNILHGARRRKTRVLANKYLSG